MLSLAIGAVFFLALGGAAQAQENPQIRGSGASPKEGPLTCVLGTAVMSHSPSDDNPTHDAEIHTCEVESDDPELSRVWIIRGLPQDIIDEHEAREQREMSIQISDIQYDSEWEISLSLSSAVQIVDDGNRRLAKRTGDSYLMILVISGSDGAERVSLESDEISERVYGGDLDGDGVEDHVNLKSQMEACSNHTLRYHKGSFDGDESGVREITLSQKLAGAEIFDILKWADDAAAAIGMNTRGYDHVLYIVPPDTKFYGQPYATYGWSWGRRSIYSDLVIPYNGELSNWVISVSALMHEVGHNLGLHHSGEGTYQYGDGTGYMGPQRFESEGPLMCFNPQKSSQLGWYANREYELNPHDDYFFGEVIGVADYAMSTDYFHMIVKVLAPNTNGNEVYITYNVQKGINAGTREHVNSVNVVEGRYAKVSWMKKGLSEGGEEYRIPNWDASGLDLVVQLLNFGKNGEIDFASIKVGLDKEYVYTAPEDDEVVVNQPMGRR